jgi:hypothetical protein
LEIINSFQQLTANLLTAKREEALNLAKRLSAAEASKKEAENQAEGARKALAQKEAEIAQKDALLAYYHTLGVVPPPLL